MLLRGSLVFIFASFCPLVAQTGGWKLTWSDEFNGPGLDKAKWTYALGGGGWGNRELENYTARAENVYVENGVLVLKAVKESCKGAQYTSGRIHTKGKFEQTYGRFEARIQMPYGQGIWPAFWMMGDTAGQGGWPDCGEIDIMENIGKEPDIAHGTIHGPGYSGAKGLGAAFTLPGGKAFKDGFHVFAVEWEPGEIRWYVDGEMYKKITKADLPAGARWVYDHPFYLLLNLAVGGDWPGYPDATTVLPQAMRVDYVRVYKKS